MNTAATHHVFFAVTESYAQHFCVAAVSLLENNKDVKLKLFVIHNDQYHPVLSLCAQFLSHTYNIEVTFINMEPLDFSVFKKTGYYGDATFFRLFLADIAPKEIDKALFLDVDLIVTGSVLPILNLDLNGHSVAAVREVSVVDNLVRLETLGEKLTGYFNAGVMLINLQRWRDQEISKEFIAIASKYGESLTWVDQDILNIQVADNWRPLPAEFNGIHLLEKLWETPIIIHYNSASKPWHYEDTHPYRDQYWKYLKLTPFKSYRPPGRTLRNSIFKYGKLFKRALRNNGIINNKSVSRKDGK